MKKKKDTRLLKAQNEIDALKLSVKVLRAQLRERSGWADALLYTLMGDPLPRKLEKKYGALLDQL